MTRVRLNVSGTIFEFDTDILRNFRGQKLAQLCNRASDESANTKKALKDGILNANHDYYVKNQNEGQEIRHDESGVNNADKIVDNVDEDITLFVDRPARCFAAILSFYQTGELHIPLDVCPGSFQREMLFWQVEASDLTECCSYRLSAFLDECETRRNFKRDTRRSQRTDKMNLSRGVQYLRWRIWSVIDYRENTLLAKAYFVFISCMVLLSIFSLALSTDASMRRSLTKCEILEYLEHSDHAATVHVAEQWRHLDCDNPTFDGGDYDYIDEIFGEDGAVFYDVNTGENITVSLPDMTVPMRAFASLDIAILAVFTVDVLLRLFSWPSVIGYFTSVVNIVDVLAIVTAYVYLVILNIEREHRYSQNWLHILNYFQVFRSLRLLRIVQTVRASQVLAYSLRQNVKDILVLILFLFFGVSTFACVIYFAESRSVIRSIPDGWYFSIITLTTVGYGDVTPKTCLGAIVASLCAVMGVVLLALTVPIFVNNFLTLYQYAVIGEYTERIQSSQMARSSDIPAVVHDESVKTNDQRTPQKSVFPQKRSGPVSVIHVTEAPVVQNGKECNEVI